MSKVIAINGSPRENGNTAAMLRTALDVCASAGHQVELFQAGGRSVHGCKGCGYCGKNPGVCSIDDWMNQLYPKMKEADAIILGSPTYFADITAEMKAVIDRCGYMSRRDGNSFSRKIGASVCAVRRCGSIHALDSMNHLFLINDMILPGSTYWNMSLSRLDGDFEKDAEGVATVTRLGENIVWLLEKLGC